MFTLSSFDVEAALLNPDALNALVAAIDPKEYQIVYKTVTHTKFRVLKSSLDLYFIRNNATKEISSYFRLRHLFVSINSTTDADRWVREQDDRTLVIITPMMVKVYHSNNKAYEIRVLGYVYESLDVSRLTSFYVDCENGLHGQTLQDAIGCWCVPGSMPSDSIRRAQMKPSELMSTDSIKELIGVSRRCPIYNRVKLYKGIIDHIILTGEKHIVEASPTYNLLGQWVTSEPKGDATAYKLKNFLVIKRNNDVSLFYIHKDTALALVGDQTAISYLGKFAAKGIEISYNYLHAYILAKSYKGLAKKAVGFISKGTTECINVMSNMPQVTEWLAPELKRTIKSQSRGSNDKQRKTVKACPVQSILTDVLRGCTPVEVDFAKSVKPSKLNFDDVLKDTTDERSATQDFARLYSKLTKIQNDMSGTWYRCDTIAQYRALTLMQGYTSYFTSCQYVALHKDEIGVVELMQYLTGAIDVDDITLTTDDDNFMYEQDRDFNREVVRYFRLDADGFVLQRFYAYRSGYNGEYYLNNFYNCTALPACIDGELFIPSSVGSFRGKSYQNDVTCPPAYTYTSEYDFSRILPANKQDEGEDLDNPF